MEEYIIKAAYVISEFGSRVSLNPAQTIVAPIGLVASFGAVYFGYKTINLFFEADQDRAPTLEESLKELPYKPIVPK